MIFPSSRKAIFLITNIRLSEKDPVIEYEKMLSNADDLFTHTWSLCVEMQWYLLAPLLFFVQNLLPLRRVLFFLGITCISLGFYLTTDSNTAFYNTFARMWQFCVGIIAFLSSENVEIGQVRTRLRLRSERLYSRIDYKFLVQITAKMSCMVSHPVVPRGLDAKHAGSCFAVIFKILTSEVQHLTSRSLKLL
ncbi:unnamed protein product [Cylicocyclus nassatus]|uniref:Acyltransferase 3 domain-containing protein n=1 Tax=Cylicocyclus nassatus TaxID=53992 RepID=A0AA36MAG1_CYLNA|nr:unnamed protein product [Cylicocyclus nassatus]